MLPNISILLIEDNPDDADFFREILDEVAHETFSFTSVITLGKAIERLKEQTFHIVFLDLSLPDAHGLDGYRKLLPHIVNMPIIILTGLDDDQTALEALRQGAQDYLIKSEIEPQLLIKSIRYAIERKRAELAEKEIDRVKVLVQTAITAAHLINQPLTSIIGYIDLIKTLGDKLSSEKRDEYLDDILTAGVAIRDIVKKMDQVERHVTTSYVDDIEMIDLDKATKKNPK